MKVAFAADVLAEPGRHGKDLNAIAERFDCGQHDWEIDDLAVLMASQWMRDRASWDSLDELAEKTFRTAIDSPKRTVAQFTVVVTLAAPKEVGRTLVRSPEEARRLVTGPLRLILENATSDGDFVRSIATTWSSSLVTNAVDRGWLVFEQAGGSGEFVKRATALLGQQVPSVRILCLMDSDRLTVGPLPVATVKRCQELDGLGVAHFVLHKREVENYLPSSRLDGDRTRGVYVSWLTLTRVQRDYFDMKLGFAEDPETHNAVVPEGQRMLFAGVSAWHLRRMIGGFGRKIGEAFDGRPLDREELDACCATKPTELRNLLEWLEAAL